MVKVIKVNGGYRVKLGNRISGTIASYAMALELARVMAAR